jgi:hypothetical protein
VAGMHFRTRGMQDHALPESKSRWSTIEFALGTCLKHEDYMLTHKACEDRENGQRGRMRVEKLHWI